MKEDKIIKNMKTEIGEETTEYGEFVSSYFAWISLSKQKEKAQELEKISKKTKDSKI